MAATNKSVRERDTEQFVDWLIGWVSGLDEDGFSPAGRGIVWLKFSIIAVGLAGFIIPACAIAFGLFISHVFFVETFPVWLHWGVVIGVSVSILGYLLWRGYLRIAMFFTMVAATSYLGFYLLIIDPIIAAQWIMVAGILIFGVPGLLALGFAGSFIAVLLQRLFWQKTPIENIKILINEYFSALIWLYVFAELAIVLGVIAPVMAIVVSILGLVGVVLIGLFWNKDLGIGRFLAYLFQVGLLTWALGVAVPSSLSLFLFGYDLRHEWGFYGLKPLTMHQRELDTLEDELAVAKGKTVIEIFDNAKEDIKGGNPEAAEKKINDLKNTYGENPMVSRMGRKIKSLTERTAGWLRNLGKQE